MAGANRSAAGHCSGGAVSAATGPHAVKLHWQVLAPPFCEGRVLHAFWQLQQSWWGDAVQLCLQALARWPRALPFLQAIHQLRPCRVLCILSIYLGLQAFCEVQRDLLERCLAPMGGQKALDDDFAKMSWPVMEAKIKG